VPKKLAKKGASKAG
jgi:hypothetical protein